MTQFTLDTWRESVTIRLAQIGRFPPPHQLSLPSVLYSTIRGFVVRALLNANAPTSLGITIEDHVNG